LVSLYLQYWWALFLVLLQTSFIHFPSSCPKYPLPLRLPWLQCNCIETSCPRISSELATNCLCLWIDLFDPFSHSPSLACYRYIGIPWGRNNVLNGGIFPSELPTFHWTQQSYVRAALRKLIVAGQPGK
jgi:hypothetical protein